MRAERVRRAAPAITALALSLLAGCGGEGASAPVTPPTPPAPPAPPTPPAPPAGFAWAPAADLQTGLPAGVELFRGRGDGLEALYARLRPDARAALEWDVLHRAGGQTPSQFAATSARRVWVAVNGGYYEGAGTRQSFSLAVQNDTVRAAGIKQLTRGGLAYFPTRAAFGELADGRLSAAWAYPVGATNLLYEYPAPAPIDPARPPLQQPDATFPAGAQRWRPTRAIGGGPMLLKDGARTATEVPEVIDAASGIGPTTRNPRTAIARLADGSLVLLVVDGRSARSRGVTLDELRDMLLALGATDAVNLDGGGSSTMVVNGVVANAPSDGTERVMPTAVVIRSR